MQPTWNIALISLSLASACCVPHISLAEDQAAQPVHHSAYKLVDLGTLGGPASYFSADYIGGVTLNDVGVATGSADTAKQDPFAPNCDRSDCYLAHAFRWEKGRKTELGALQAGLSSDASAINSRGWVAGLAQNGLVDPVSGAPEYHAVAWFGSQIIDLGTLGGGTQSVATQINDRGQVLGFSSTNIPDPFSINGPTQLRTFVWENGRMQDIGTLGGPNAQPFSINNRGQVAGMSYTSFTANPGTGFPTADPFLWEKGLMTDLGSLGGTFGTASGLNERGQVIGGSNLSGDQTYHPFLWSPEKHRMRDLGTLGGNNGFANWINAQGEVVGYADLAGSLHQHAFLWKGGVMQDIGSVDGDPCSTAVTINISEQIVGASWDCRTFFSHAFLWEHGDLVDLDAFVPANSRLQHLVMPMNINDRGVIYGVGVPVGVLPKDVESKGRVFLLIPCYAGEPGCICAPAKDARGDAGTLE